MRRVDELADPLGRPVLRPDEPLAVLARARLGVARRAPRRLEPAVYVYAWGNNPRRAELKGRRCIVEDRGAMRTVLVRFLDTGERVTTSARAIRREARP